MGWVKANGYVFNSDEVIAVGPPEPILEDRDGGGPAESELQTKVVLRAGFDFYLRGTAARRFREMFLEGLSGAIRDHDAVQVSETRVLTPQEHPVTRPSKTNG